MTRFSLLVLPLLLFFGLGADAQTQFHRSFAGIKPDRIISTADGGCLVSGSRLRPRESDRLMELPLLLKLTSIGTIEWGMIYDADIDIIMTEMIQTADGGYVIGGATISPQGKSGRRNDGEGTSFLIKVNSAGAPLWIRSFSMDSVESRVVDLAENAEGEIIALSGYGESSFLTISRYGRNGEELSRHSLGLDPGSLPALYSDSCLTPKNTSCYRYGLHPWNLTLTEDGSVAIAGTIRDYPCEVTSYAFITLLSPDGEPQWGESFFTRNGPVDMQSVGEDRIMVTFRVPEPDFRCTVGFPYCRKDLQVTLPERDEYPWTSLYQSDGIRCWSKSYQGEEYPLNVLHITKEESGDVLLASGSGFFQEYMFGREITLTRIDTAGTIIHSGYAPDNVLEEMEYHTPLDEDGEYIDEEEDITYDNDYALYAPTFDNGLFFTGLTERREWPYSHYTLHLFRLDPLFSYGCRTSTPTEAKAEDVEVPYEPFRLIPVDLTVRERVPPKITTGKVSFADSLFCFDSQELFPGGELSEPALHLVVRLYPSRVRVNASVRVEFEGGMAGAVPTVSVTHASSGQTVLQLSTDAIGYDRETGRGSGTISTAGLVPGIYLVKVRAGAMEGIAKLSVE